MQASLRKAEPIPWARFLTATAFLAGCAALVALALSAVSLITNFEAFFTRNETAKFLRQQLLATMMITGAAPLLIAALAALVGRADGARAIERTAKLAAPLALLWAIAALAAYGVWRSHPLEFLALLSVTVLGLELALRHSLTAAPGFMFAKVGELYDRIPAVLRRALPSIVVLAAAAAYSGFVGYHTVNQHHRLGTAAFDLGIYDNLLYNAIAGHPFRSPVLFGSGGGNYIAGHAEFVMLLFAPLYRLAPRAETLLILQAVMLGGAAIPLYAFAKTQIPRWSAVLVSVAYLLFAPLHGPNFYDFHYLPLSIPFVFALFWAIATRRNILVWLFFWILVSTREDISVGLALLGIFLVITGQRVLLGSAMAVFAVVSFVIIKFVIMPAAGTWWFEDLYKSFIPAGSSGYSSVVQTILINPVYFVSTLLEKEKLIYALHLFAPLAFLPMRRWYLLLGASGGFFFTLMTTGYAPTLNIAFQYGCHWIPYLFGASVLALRLIGRDEVLGTIRRRAAMGALCVGVFLHSLVFGAILQRSNFVAGFGKIPFKITQEEATRYSELRELIAMIPRDASVAATEAETPHISNRFTAYAVRGDIDDVQYILIRKSAIGGLNGRTNVGRAMTRNDYGLLARRGEFFLLKRDHTSPETDAALAELGLTPKK